MESMKSWADQDLDVKLEQETKSYLPADGINFVTALDAGLMQKTAVSAHMSKELKDVLAGVDRKIREAAAEGRRSVRVMDLRSSGVLPATYRINKKKVLKGMAIFNLAGLFLGSCLFCADPHTGLAGFLVVEACAIIAMSIYIIPFINSMDWFLEPIGIAKEVVKYCEDRGFRVRAEKTSEYSKPELIVRW